MKEKAKNWKKQGRLWSKKERNLRNNRKSIPKKKWLRHFKQKRQLMPIKNTGLNLPRKCSWNASLKRRKKWMHLIKLHFCKRYLKIMIIGIQRITQQWAQRRHSDQMKKIGLQVHHLVVLRLLKISSQGPGCRLIDEKSKNTNSSKCKM